MEGATVVIIVEALIVGLAVGAILGLVGAGGAVLAVPAFLYLFDFTALQATTASLAVVAVAAAFGAKPRMRLGQGRFRQALLFWILGVAGTLAGTRIAPHIPETALIAGFALVMVGAAFAMWRKGSGPEPVGTRETSLWLTVVVASGVGLLTGIFGVGDVVTYTGKLKLILTGFAEAAIAARSAYALIHPETPLHFEYSTTSGVPDA